MKLSFLLSFLFPFVSALVLHAGVLPYNMETISIADGLCSNDVYAVVQDGSGYMWFGTDNGIDRYDGKTIVHYDHCQDNSFSLSNSTVNCLHYSDKYGLLAGTEEGLSRYVPEKDIFVNFLSGEFGEENIRTIFEEDTVLWVGTNTGLYCCVSVGDDINTSDITNYNTGNSGLNHDIVRAVYVDDEYVFAGTFDGISRLDRRTGKWYNLNFKKKHIQLPLNNLILSILPSKHSPDTLYIGMQTGFCILDRNTMKYDIYDRSSVGSMSNNTIKSICYVNDDLWLGTEEGMVIYDNGVFSSFGYEPGNVHSLPGNIVWQVYKDRNDIVWIATEGGVAYYDAGMPDFKKTDLTGIEGNPYTGVSFFTAAFDSSDRIWLGSRLGLCSYSMESGGMKWHALSNAVPGTYNFTRGLYIDGNDILWAGTAEGVICYDIRSGTEIPVQTFLKNRLKYINTVKRIGDKVLVCDVFGRFQIISFKFDSRTRTFSRLSDSIFSVGESVETMEYDGESLWFGTAGNGILRYDMSGNLLKHYTFVHDGKSGDIPNKVNCIYYDRKTSGLYAGTDKGLLRYAGEYDDFAPMPGIPNEDVVYAMTTDDSGLLWLTTYGSVVCYDTETSVIKTFPLSHWLDSPQMICSAAISNGSDVYVFCMDSFMKLSRFDIKDNDQYLPLRITSLNINDRPYNDFFEGPVDEIRRLILSHDRNNLSFCFSMLDYTSPDIIAYTYRLEGYERNWNTVNGTQDYVEYARLKPGDYKLCVKAVNGYGLPAANDLSVDIRIRDPWWMTRIAVLLYMLAAFSVCYCMVVMVRRRRAAEVELQKEKLEKEKIEGVNEIKMLFFTNISHDFKTPLSLILSPVESLMDTETDPDRLKKLKIIRQNANRLLQLVNQILDFRKVEEQKIKLHPTSGDLVGLLGEICRSFREMAGSRKIALLFESDEDHIIMDFDRDKVDKIFANIISNAVKFTKVGGQVLVSVERKDGDRVEILVADTGIGIPRNALPHIFERFYRVEGNVGLGGEGTGIGLTIVKEFVELHHGSIEVHSKKDTGTTFIVTLPIVNEVKAQPSAISSRDPSSEDVPETHGNQAFSVLIVEDNDDMLQYIQSEFRKYYKAFTASSAEDALKIVADEMPDLVISDVMLPGMSGVDMCRKLKNDFITDHIPVVLLTAKTAEEYVIEGYDAGADEYIGKPFNMKVLLRRCENILRQRKHLREILQRDTIEIDHVERQSPDDIFIRNVVKLIEDNIADPDLDIPFLCDRLAVSHVNFYRKVKAITGVSVNVLIREIRLKRAAQLLRIKGVTVSDAMYDVGFSHRSYFSKCFKEMFGVTPKTYAKEYNNNDEYEE